MTLVDTSSQIQLLGGILSEFFTLLDSEIRTHSPKERYLIVYIENSAPMARNVLSTTRSGQIVVTRASIMKRLNTKRLSRIIKNVEASLETQELSLSAEEKADLIVSLYRLADKEGRIPDRMTTDRLVWLA